MRYTRRLLTPLSQQLETREIIVLTGMRRSGKTTLLHMLYDAVPTENKIFLDLENPIVQKAFEEQNYDNIVANFREYGLDPSRRAYIFLDDLKYNGSYDSWRKLSGA